MVQVQFTPKFDVIQPVKSEPIRVSLCELCGNEDGVQFTADPDKGGLLLCADCRRLFGFDQADERRAA